MIFNKIADFSLQKGHTEIKFRHLQFSIIL